jgi:hypothetical protein
MNTKKVNGYVMPLCLYNIDSPSKEEKEWVETFNNIVEKCKDHLIEKRDELEQWDLSKNDLKKLNPLYYKREKGKIVEGRGPTLYAKLIMSKKLNKILSMFYDASTQEDLDPLDLKGKYCHVKAAIKFESIFIGTKISLQVKLYEAEVKLMSTGMKRLLGPSKPVKILSTPANSNHMVSEDDLSDGSINNSSSDEEEEEPVKKPAPVKKKKIIRRVKKT